MKARRLLDREDPRTVLSGTIFILGIGMVIAVPLLDSGLPVAIVVVWFAVSVAQVIWAGIRYSRWRRQER